MLGKVVNKRKKRVGRGPASGKGKNSGRGENGQKSRSGKKFYAGFEGGQTPLKKRIPKLPGFRNPRKKEYVLLNLARLEKLDESVSYTKEKLFELGIIPKIDCLVKVLGEGAISKSIKIQADKISKSAREALEKAGGSIL